MAWIEVHQSLFTHRKTLELADLLGVPEVYAAAHLISLWAWALDNAPDGALHVRRTIIARASRWSGDVDALCNALVNSGFLEQRENDVFVIHDWADYAGRLVEKRRQNAQRMREARSKQAPEPRATHVQRTLHARAGATVPNRTVPNQTKPERESRMRATTLPEDFSISDETRMKAKREGIGEVLDLDKHTARFVEYWSIGEGAGKRKQNWNFQWLKWMRDEADKAQARGGNGNGAHRQNAAEVRPTEIRGPDRTGLRTALEESASRPRNA